MQTIGFIGLGHMGKPMVSNLVSAGFRVLVYDRLENAMQACAQDGAIPVKDLKAIAEGSEIIFTMLQTGEQVQAVCLSPDGLFAHAKPETLFIDSSSIQVEISRSLNREAVERGFKMLDAPVSGGVAGAEQASLTIMVGGDVENFEKAKPVFSYLGKNIIHAGPAGNGQVAKICNNMILGISMIAVSEAFCLAQQLGLAPEKLFEISSQASGQCWAMTAYSPVPGLVEHVPSNNDYQPGFTAAMMLKDLKLSQAAAQLAQASTPLGHKATVLYQDFVNTGHGEIDFSAIIKLFEHA